MCPETIINISVMITIIITREAFDGFSLAAMPYVPCLARFSTLPKPEGPARFVWSGIGLGSPRPAVIRYLLGAAVLAVRRSTEDGHVLYDNAARIRFQLEQVCATAADHRPASDSEPGDPLRTDNPDPRNTPPDSKLSGEIEVPTTKLEINPAHQSSSRSRPAPKWQSVNQPQPPLRSSRYLRFVLVVPRPEQSSHKVERRRIHTSYEGPPLFVMFAAAMILGICITAGLPPIQLSVLGWTQHAESRSRLFRGDKCPRIVRKTSSSQKEVERVVKWVRDRAERLRERKKIN
ncbi:hypothetical protein CpipJ_CPIJ005066 [Culex quinquefasciatus]|uniref:Uncharacterized protein n=1 Tax=Culex quinquefasciatus TaxID=7176 RepID=B0WCW3_CULQU|nr:hypothetical protein CpipJ_CPIJ005066 [Culex quinquefasciatus]|eukprot:XP_001846547.1 hypothetical protein CpipJ_CPIJ005066 [Culex quinquefasciatus]